MNDVVNILKFYVQVLDTIKLPPILVANIRSFIQLLKSFSFQPIIASLKEQKYNDLKKFNRFFLAIEQIK